MAVRWGMAMASTKCCWNAGSVAVSIFSTAPTTSWISRRAEPDNKAITAPAPAALPTETTRSGSQSGIRPKTVARSVSIWLPKAPANPMESTWSTPRWSMRSLTPA